MLKEWITRIAPWISPSDDSEPRYRIALDIGTEFVKAVYLEQTGEVSSIIGVGRAHQDYQNMDSGAVANISGVVRSCRQAMTQGAVIAGVKPEEAVIGVAGQFVTGVVRTVIKTRKKPEKPLTRRELSHLVLDVHKDALAQTEAVLAERMGFDELDLELVNSSIVNLTIDGYPVTNPVDFCGRNLEITVFMTFAPLVHVNALKTLAQRLDLDLIGLVAEPYAVAASTFTDEAYELGSVVIDIGGGSTDIALIHRGGISQTKMLSIGGRAFTKSIADYTQTSISEAEQLKLDYASGMDSHNLEPVIATDLSIWRDAMLLGLKEMLRGKPLPPRIVLCGGGSALPGIIETLADQRFVDSGIFQVKPKIQTLTPEDVYGIADPKEYFTNISDVTPKCIAYQASLVEANQRNSLGGVQLG